MAVVSMLVVRRAGAYLVDCLWLSAMLMGLQLAIVSIGLHGDGAWRTSGVRLEAWTLATISLPAWLMLAGFESSRPGATPGKRLLALRVEDVTGHRLGFGRALLRNVVKLLPWEAAHLAINLPRNPFIDPQTGAFTGMADGEFRWTMVLPWVLAVVWVVVFARDGERGVQDRVAGSRVRRGRRVAAMKRSSRSRSLRDQGTRTT